MANLDSLRELLADEIKDDISLKNGRTFAMLKETGKDSKLRRVDIYDIPEGSILVKIDQFKPPDSLFKSNKGQCKRCDYVLITTVKNKDILLFIEIKSTKIEDKEIMQQFKGAECVIDYCDAALNRFHNQNNLLREHNKRFVVFYKLPISKQPTRLQKQPQQNNDIPERAYKYPNPNCPSLHALIYL